MTIKEVFDELRKERYDKKNLQAMAEMPGGELVPIVAIDLDDDAPVVHFVLEDKQVKGD